MKGLGVFFIVLFLVGMESCSPKQKTVLLQNPEINANNIVDNLAQQIQHYPKEPYYLISYTNSLCFFEILVNDIPVYKEFESFSSGSGFGVNHVILKSGTQKVSYRIYPRAGERLDNNAKLNLRVMLYENTDSNDKGVNVKEYALPIIPNPDKKAYEKEIFAGTGKTFYEGSFTFEAEVLYKLEDFENAQDLRKMDKKELEAILLKKYKEVRNIYQSKDYDNIARLSYGNLKNQFVAKYSDQKYIHEVWDMLMDAYTANNFKMQPIENYELKFFAEGKLVALMTKSRESWARGNSALWGEFDRGEGEEFVFCNRYFYILKGENDFRVY